MVWKMMKIKKNIYIYFNIYKAHFKTIDYKDTYNCK